MDKVISLKISKDLLKSIDDQAKKEYRTRTSFLISCAMDYIKKKNG